MIPSVSLARIIVTLGLIALCRLSHASAGTGFELIVAPQTLRSDQATLVWQRPENAPPTTTYEIYHRGEQVGKTLKTHFTVRGITPQSDHVFSVIARPDLAAEPISSTPLTLTTPAQEPVVSITDHGAVGDGKTVNTVAIQTAIAACPVGGVVLIPKGVFLSGAIFLKSDITLEIAKGGVLKGTTALKDYEPHILTRFEGWELESYASLINAGKLDHSGPANIHNLSIRGKGTITGGGRMLGDAMTTAHGLRSRSRLICLMNAQNVEIQGLTLENTPCWTFHYIYSEAISCHDLTIRSEVHNGDGIDPDSSRNSYIFNCSFATSDDCIAIKSGKNPEGNVVNRPTEKIRIFDCRFDQGHGISIGSEMSGGVREVVVEDCIAGDLLYGFQIKATKDRGGFVEDVTVRNCNLRMITVYSSVPYNNDGEAASKQPYFRNLRFIDIDLSQAKTDKPVIDINGFSANGHQTRKVTFDAIKLPAKATIKIDQAEEVSFTRITTADGERPDYQISRSGHVSR